MKMTAEQLDPKTNSVYANVSYCGKKLVDWQKELGNQYSLGELFLMMKSKRDLNRLKA